MNRKRKSLDDVDEGLGEEIPDLESIGREQRGHSSINVMPASIPGYDALSSSLMTRKSKDKGLSVIQKRVTEQPEFLSIRKLDTGYILFCDYCNSSISSKSCHVAEHCRSNKHVRFAALYRSAIKDSGRGEAESSIRDGALRAHDSLATSASMPVHIPISTHSSGSSLLGAAAPAELRIFDVDRDQRIVVAVGSLNPVKIRAVVLGLAAALKIEAKLIFVEGFNAESGVPAQPMGDNETRQGAVTRAKGAFALCQQKMGSSPQYAVGLEGGVGPTLDDLDMECFAWMAVYNGKFVSTARTAAFVLPRTIRDLVQSGIELGDADDKVFGTSNAKQGDGTVGHLTRNVIDRTQYYQPAVILAMIPFLWPQFYSSSDVDRHSH